MPSATIPCGQTVTIRRNSEFDATFQGSLLLNRRETGTVGRVVFASSERNGEFYLVEHGDAGRYTTAAYKPSEVVHTPSPVERDYSIAGITDAGVTLGNGAILHWDELAVLVHQLDRTTIEKTGYSGHAARVAAGAAATFAAHLDLMWKRHLESVSANGANSAAGSA